MTQARARRMLSRKSYAYNLTARGMKMAAFELLLCMFFKLKKKFQAYIDKQNKERQ
jgi:hypothetical protein